MTDLDLSKFIAHFHEHEAIASFVSVRPTQTFHSVHTEDGSVVTDIVDVRQGGMWINGGYFILRNRIFDYMEDGDELVVEPFRRLIGEKKLITYPHDSFWACMDTFKEQQHLDEMYRQGPAAWEVWRTKGSM